MIKNFKEKKMVLKNNEKKTKKIDFAKIKKHFNYKNLLFFLGSFLVIGILIGIIFYLYMNSNDKEIINNNISSYFKIEEYYNYLDLLKSSIFNNIGNIIIIWLLGISIIGIFIIIFLFFIESFSIGFSISAIIGNYGSKGIIGIISYLIPGRLLYLIMLYLITYFAIYFSVQLIKYLFFKQDVDLRKALNRYFKNLVLIIIIAIICSLFEVFVDPLMIKLFTFLIK